jgi:intracellular septation protein
MSNQMVSGQTRSVRALLLGGVIPVVLFTVVEEVYGTWWGLVAGMVFGVGEILYEKIKQGRVDPITWIGNGLILVLGAVSLFTKEGVWFKLQPAILEVAMGLLLLGSVIAGHPFLTLMAQKQNMFDRIPAAAQPVVRQSFSGFTARLGIFFLAHAVLATWAALHWSTRAWALLKGVGFTVTLIAYMLIEMFYLKRKLKPRRGP